MKRIRLINRDYDKYNKQVNYYFEIIDYDYYTITYNFNNIIVTHYEHHPKLFRPSKLISRQYLSIDYINYINITFIPDLMDKGYFIQII